MTVIRFTAVMLMKGRWTPMQSALAGQPFLLGLAFVVIILVVVAVVFVVLRLRRPSVEAIDPTTLDASTTLDDTLDFASLVAQDQPDFEADDYPSLSFDADGDEYPSIAPEEEPEGWRERFAHLPLTSRLLLILAPLLMLLGLFGLLLLLPTPEEPEIIVEPTPIPVTLLVQSASVARADPLTVTIAGASTGLPDGTVVRAEMFEDDFPFSWFDTELATARVRNNRLEFQIPRAADAPQPVETRQYTVRLFALDDVASVPAELIVPSIGGIADNFFNRPVAQVPTPTPTATPTATLFPEPEPGVPTDDPALEGPATATPTVDGPIGEGTPPPMPTLALTTVPPTAVPPPIQPTLVQPTSLPLPTALPQPTPTDDPSVVAPTPPLLTPIDPAPPSTATPEPRPTLPPPPTVPPPPPADVLSGDIRWSRDQGPLRIERDVQLAPGSELIIEPGVEVQLAPGVAIFVDGGRLLALGQPDQPVRFVSATGARWNGIFMRPNSFVVLEHAEVRGAGLGGTLLASERSELIVRSTRFTDNGGAILLNDTRLEMRDSEVTGNDMPFGPALEATYGRGNFITLTNNRFGGNRLSEGAPQVRISNRSTFETLNLTVEGNLIRGGAPNLQLTTNGPLQGTVGCNALVGDAQGFGLRTQTPQVNPNGVPPMALRIENNLIDEHLPPIIPVYLRYGLGRGATSEILLDMRNNWWGEASGPYEPETNPLGRGDSVGNNIIYAPWLTAPPSCLPPQ
ncbi:hypothetical protein EYB53_020025 [Candidatus Chloroploca sp. M-50]|uniref:Right handed beta helix domain-containing protein n=1 Tax=Candidatus Chloroploca mongolica TaxID=2528176 RepID=A0ABS4DF11_9CHLR|nr:hypothetical protein [Candidatus Chloroploca mongolica]MBP1468016.1 hypothetical protein [Candidatus Chloroploca mongolica]